MKINLFTCLVIIFITLNLISCASPDRVVFVTSTEIGVGADAKTGNVNIGYDRNEMIVGPAYPDTGASPPVYGRIESNLEVFEPEIKQLYATGNAAHIATGSSTTGTIGTAPAMTGKRKLMFFGTSTNVGFKMHFTSNAPDSINLGYKRRELSVIPLQDKDPTTNKPDKYASVIAGIGMTTSSTNLSGSGIKLSQFIATGSAAENVAMQSKNIFTKESSDALDQATTRGIGIAKDRKVKIAEITSYVAPSNLLDKTKLTSLFTNANIPSTDNNRKYVEKSKNADDLNKRLQTSRPLVDPLFNALP